MFSISKMYKQIETINDGGSAEKQRQFSPESGDAIRLKKKKVVVVDMCIYNLLLIFFFLI